MSLIQVAICKTIDGIPSEIQVIPYGSHETEKGAFFLDEEGMAAITAAFARRKNDMVIDYEHQTIEGGEAPAAGWIKKLVNRGKDGLWAVVEWTERAKEYLKNREYRYLSPVFLKTIEDGKVVRLLNAGLTNTPAIDGMVPVVNKGNPSSPPLEKGGEGGFENANKEVRMKKLLKLLALKEGATEEQALEAVKGMADDARQLTAMKAAGLDPEAVIAAASKGEVVVGVAHRDVLDSLGLKAGASVSEVTGTITAMKQGQEQTGDLAKEVAALKEDLARRDAEDLVESAMKEGKVTPAMRDWAVRQALKDRAGFDEFVARQPVIVDEKERAGGAGPAGGNRDKKREHLVAEHMKTHNVSYKDAVLAVSREHPGLFRD